ncbi:hypothetical protein [Patulibacter defluvii]|uniref:hypothetical protein n=1 Tax=Patulibacter defluvii TaxID=3095358 RepID=UPI002A766B09|nr:hypothetical protein [Patulibacter sp. DM4]
MSKRHDAFGREIEDGPAVGARPEGEGGAADAGAATSAPRSSERPRTVSSPPVPAEGRPTPRPRPSDGSRAAARTLVATVLLTIVGVGVAGVLAVSHDEGSSLEGTVDGGTSRTTYSSSSTTTIHPDGRTTVDGRTVAGASAPTGLRPGSMLRPAAVARVLRRARARGDRVLALRVAPDRIDATVMGTRRLRVVSVSWRGETSDVVAGPVPRVLPTLPVGRIDPAAPSRIAARAARALGRGTSRVDYLALAAIGGSARWTLFFRDGPSFSGSGDGRSVSRLG